MLGHGAMVIGGIMQKNLLSLSMLGVLWASYYLLCKPWQSYSGWLLMQQAYNNSLKMDRASRALNYHHLDGQSMTQPLCAMEIPGT